ncbi:MAG: YitT family protein [Clostridia bacterium]|nr:YitT family protein [Clostridia bacterium]
MKTRIKEFLKDIIYYIVGGSIYTVAVTTFLSANEISPGGVTGIATVLNFLLNTPIGGVVFLINVPLFIIAVFKFGKGFIIKTAIATAITSILLDLLVIVLPIMKIDLILASIFGGTLMGLGVSIIMLRGSSTGGVEIVAKLVSLKYPYVSMGRLMLLLDFSVVVVSALVYKNAQSALYSTVALYSCSKIMDLVLYGADKGKVIYIISDKAQYIVCDILNKIGRGATFLDVRGAYTGDKRQMIMCTVRRNEVHNVYAAARQHDKSAFIVVCEAGEILGEGFKK